MKLNTTIIISFLSTLFTLLGLTCNALPILANFAREYQSSSSISPPKPSSTYDIYSNDLFSADGKSFPTSLAYYTDSTKQPLSSSSGFLLLPNSVTASTTLPDSPSRQTVFLDIHGSVIKLDQTSQSSFLSRSISRPSVWLSSLRKREAETEQPEAIPSRLVRLEGATKASILPTTSVHYNLMNNRAIKKRNMIVKPRGEDAEEKKEILSSNILIKPEVDKGELAKLKEEEEKQRSIEDCERFEEKGLLPQGSCHQHLEVQDYADRFVKRDLIETVNKAANQNTTVQADLSLNILKDIEVRLQTELDQVRKAMQLIQSKVMVEQDKKKKDDSKDPSKKAKDEDDDDSDDDDDDDKDSDKMKKGDEKKAEKEKEEKEDQELKKVNNDGDEE